MREILLSSYSTFALLRLSTDGILNEELGIMRRYEMTVLSIVKMVLQCDHYRVFVQSMSHLGARVSTILLSELEIHTANEIGKPVILTNYKVFPIMAYAGNTPPICHSVQYTEVLTAIKETVNK